MPNPMQPMEVIRAIAITAIAAALLLIIQPWLYQATGLEPIQLSDPFMEVEEWLSEHYLPGATIVLAFSLFAQVVWFLLAVNYKGRDDRAEGMLLPWSLLLIISLLGVGIALFVIETADAFPSLVLFWLIATVTIYWLATAMNTPTALKYIIPGSQYLRRIFG